MTGVVYRVSSWLTSSPPTIVIPSGRRNSAPSPKPIASGTRQRARAAHSENAVGSLPDTVVTNYWNSPQQGMKSSCCTSALSRSGGGTRRDAGQIRDGLFDRRGIQIALARLACCRLSDLRAVLNPEASRARGWRFALSDGSFQIVTRL